MNEITLGGEQVIHRLMGFSCVSYLAIQVLCAALKTPSHPQRLATITEVRYFDHVAGSP